MNKSKLTALTAIATVMSASAAYADLTLGGAIAGNVKSGDDTTGISSGVSTSSVVISYSSTLDNGMGMSAGFSITSGANNFSVSIDTGMGSLSFGETHSGAVDAVDGMPAGVNTISPTVELSGTATTDKYNDGDDNQGQGIMYTSPSVNGFTARISTGETIQGTGYTTGDRVTAMSVTGSLMGLSLAAGQVDQADGEDDNFATVGYSIAGVSLGYGMYDSDGDGSHTVMGANASMAGLTFGIEVEDFDAAAGQTDEDMTKYSVSKDLGGMAVTLIYKDRDNGVSSDGDNQNWTLYYSVGF